MLRTLALLALVCLCAGAKTYRRTMPMPDNADLEPMNSELTPFRARTEHRFLYNMQIASGLIAPTDEDATSAPQQKAVMRGQCLVRLQFASEQHAQLRLEQCRIGEQNEPMSEPQMVQPMDAFEKKWIPEDKKKQLELPCQFSYEDGLIERVQFHEEDDVWSKNMKRAVLNMVQMNLKPKNQQEEQGIEKANQQGKTYTIPETTLEGACQTSYTIYKLRGEQPQQFNLTKSIDFKQCQQIADVAYGYQTQQPQAKCAHCQRFWAQQQGQQQLQNGEEHLCAKCDPKEVKEQELDRSTVIRCQIQKDDQEAQQIALKRCELVSQYVYRNGKIEDGAYGSAMQTVVSASLQARGGAALQAEAEQQIPALESGKEESLMYSNQWEVDVKRFYMFGDHEFGQNGKDSPFARVPKVQQAEQALRKLAQAMEDKQRGIEQQAPAQLQRLVEMMRQSTQAELKRIEQNARNTQEKQIFTNALAMCGTRNCVALLAQKIKNKEIHSAQAVQALLALNQLPAPSDPIVQEIEQLCTGGSESVKERPALKQSCWLTFGALVNELCQYNNMEKNNNDKGQQKIGFIPQEHQCPMAMKQQYKEAMLAVYKNSDCIYDKMVALNALGNAGLDISVKDLEQIIRDAGEARVVRVKAIDALRRLRVRMPRRIQRILTPIFQNTREHPQVRTAAFAITMYSQPESQLVDQLVYTIGKEPNKQVRAFAYRTMKMMANSQNPNERKIAQHIKAALKVANVDEEELRGVSGKWQVPLLYNTEQREGLFATVATTISTRSALPVYAHAQLDTQFNDQFQHNAFKLYMMQQEAEQWYQKMTGNFKQVSRAQRQTKGRHSDKVRNIFNLLGIKNRLADNYQEKDDDNKLEPNQNRNQPFAMLCLRTNDVDRGFVALDRQILSGKLNLPGLAELMLNQLQPYINGAMVANLNEKTVQIPTSVGVPLKVLNSMPAITNIQGQAKINQAESGQNGIKMETNMQVAATMAHIQKMECWTPFLVSGVQSIRSAELNLPLHTELNADLRQAEISIKIKLPRDQTQLAAIRTLPITYTASVDSRTGLIREPSQMRTIHNPKLERQQRETDMVVSGLKAMGMPMRVQGFFHRPSYPSFEQFVQMLMATENSVRIVYEPETNSPRELVFRASTAPFQKVLISEHPQQLGDFYNTRMDSAYACDAAEDGECDMFAKHEQEDAQEMEQQQQEDRQKQLNTFIEQYKKDGEQYKHTLKLSMQTDKGARAQCEMQVQCDARVQFCKVQMKADRTPMFQEESRKWMLKADAQLVMPETDAVPMTQQQQREDQKTHKQFIARVQAQWGEQYQQKVNLRVHGTQAYTAQVRHILQDQQREGRDLVSPRQMEQLHRRTAFLNKFHVEAEYSLKAKAQNTVRWMIELLKSAYFWNTKSHMKEFGAQKEGKAVATVVIDPLTLKHANVTIKTPAQRVRIHQIELPFRVRPFSLIRLQSAQQTHSLAQLFHRFSVDKRAECTADGETIKTFDDSEYASPLMTNCYSVLAKDCGSDQQPQFAVMMRKAQQNAQGKKMANNGEDWQQKAIKVMTPEQEIECRPKPIGESLICWIDGQQVDPEEQQQNQAETVQYNNEQMDDVTIMVEGMAVRFNGRKAWLKVSPMYKSAVCGLCGHYDDSTDREDEWHMADGKTATNLAQFHRSYALHDTKVCTQQELDNFYKNDDDNKDNHGEFYRHNGEYQKLNKFNKIQDEEQFNGQLDFAKFNKFDAYKNIFGIETNNDYGRQCCCCCDEDDTECKQDCREGEQCRERCRNQQCQEQQKEEDKMSPVWKTKVSEQHHAVCFSIKPVKQCPRGTMELEQYAEEDEDEPKRKQHLKTVRFVCLDRADPEARRLFRSLRQGQRVVAVPEERGASFTERVREPQQCRPYREEGLF